MAEVELMNMCMVVNAETRQVLAKHNTRGWLGVAFPGGHIEDGEDIVSSVIREVREETGLTIADPKFRGVVHWCHMKNHTRSLIFYFMAESYSGQLVDRTDEGEVFWADIDQMPKMDLAPGFLEQLPLFFHPEYFEGFVRYDDETVEPIVFTLKRP